MLYNIRDRKQLWAAAYAGVRRAYKMKIVLKIAISIIILFVIGIGAGFYAMSGFFDDMCGNYVFESATSPDSTFKAVLFQRDCGATTGFSTQVSLIATKDSLNNNEGGNILIIDGHPSFTKISIQWINEHQLAISNLGNAYTYKKETFFRGVNVIFK